MYGGSGIANIIAAVIVAAAILWTGGFGGGNSNQDRDEEWIARAVGDIRNDIVVNCGCCGEGGERPARKSAARSF